MRESLIDEKKLERVIEKVRKLVDKELGVDSDGDSLVEVEFVDRSRYHRSHFYPVPYDFPRYDEPKDKEAIERLRFDAMKIEIDNLQTATKAVEFRMRGMESLPVYKIRDEEAERVRKWERKMLKKKREQGLL